MHSESGLEKYYEILELEIGASPEDIRAAYKDLIKVWHPDRFAKDPKLQARAQARMQAINEAYDVIRSQQVQPPARGYWARPARTYPTSAKDTPDAPPAAGKAQSSPTQWAHLQQPRLWTKRQWTWSLIVCLCLAAAIVGAFNASRPDAQMSRLQVVWPVNMVNRDSYVRPFGDQRAIGINFPGIEGEQVLAAMSGRVTAAGWYGEYGYTVIIASGSDRTLYGHLSALFVNLGDTVVEGEEIARLGATGNANNPRLRFELWVDGEAVNPKPYLR